MLIPIYFHHTDETYNCGIKRSKYFYTQLLENITAPPTSQMYLVNVTGLSITEHNLHRSYTHKVKQIKDKKLEETEFQNFKQEMFVTHCPLTLT